MKKLNLAVSNKEAQTTILTSDAGHWFQNKAMQFHGEGRKPTTIREWLRCIYNADIFYGRVPVLKTVIIINEIVYRSIQLLK